MTLKNSLCFVLSLCISFSVFAQQQVNSKQEKEAQVNWRKNAESFSDGLKYRLEGKSDRAIECFKKALKYMPDDHASMYELTELYALNGQIDEALEYNKKAVSLDPKNKWYQIRLAQLYEFTGDYEAYAAIFKNLLKEDPDNLEYFAELSSALMLLEKYDEVIAILNEMEKNIGVNEFISFEKQQIYDAMGKPKKAIEEVEKLAKAYPYEIRYQAMLAELYMKNKKTEQALKAYERIIELDPSNPYVHISLSEYYTEKGDLEKGFEQLLIAFENPALDVNTKSQILAIWFDGKKRTELVNNQAREIAQVMIKTHPENARGYQLMGDVYYGESKFKEAVEYLEMSLAIDSASFYIWETLLMAQANDDPSDVEKINSFAERALKLFPDQPLLYYFSGVSFFEQKKYEEALQRFTRGSRFLTNNNPMQETFFTFIGDLHHLRNQNKEAYEAYEKVLKMNPDNSLVLNNYAYYLSLEGANLDKALQMAAKAVELDSENVSNIDTYAWVFYKLGRYEDALKWIEKAIEKSPQPSGTIIEHQGDILFRLGNKNLAVQKWKEAKKAGETSEWIEKKIKDGKLYE
ncbi:MAG: tetratricopeptide repeat protein [Lentimicrobiaceae bacterium]|jgi:tetratricopeptide (TPR) repeat protein|nr:tetratricopeptide repeat protein [Lentimicrobiaceae bacterium]